MTETDTSRWAEVAVDKVKDLEKDVKRLRKELSAKESAQSRACRQFHSEKSSTARREKYRILKEARAATRKIRGDLAPKETALHAARAESYYWNNVLKGARTKKPEEKEERMGKDKKKKEKMGVTSTPTWSRHTLENATERIDISSLRINSRGKPRRVVFAGTDYGVCKMSETSALTLEEIEEHINRYRLLSGKFEVELKFNRQKSLIFFLKKKCYVLRRNGFIRSFWAVISLIITALP
jgi:hypothetical protein